MALSNSGKWFLRKDHFAGIVDRFFHEVRPVQRTRSRGDIAMKRRNIFVIAAVGLLLSGTMAARSAQAQQSVVVNCTFELEWCEALRVKFEATTGMKAAISRKTDGEVLA